MKVVKRILLLFFIIITPCYIYAQITFMRAYNTPAPSGSTEESDSYSVHQTSDGGYILAGWCSGFWTYRKHEFYMIKTDASGDTLWSKTYGGPEMEEATYVSQTSDGGFIVTGYSRGFGTTASLTEPYVIKTDASGDTMWTRTYGTGKAQYEGGLCIKQTTDGGYILTGSMGNNGYDVGLFKLTANGDTSWTRTYGGNSSDGGWTLQQTSDGGYVVAGTTSSYGAGSSDIYVVKTNSTGDTLWTKTYGGSSSESGEYGTGPTIQQTPDGGYIILGSTYSFGAGDRDMYLIRTNSSGDTLWTRAYGGTDAEEGSSMDQTADGGYILVGYTRSFGAGNRDAYLIKVNASGDTLWTRVYGGSDYDKGRAIEQTADGGFIISGVTWSYTSNWQDMFLIKTDGSGNIDECTGNVGTTKTIVSKTSTKVSSGGIKGSGCTISNTQTIVKNVSPIDRVVCELLTPIADFEADDTVICVSDCISFTDLSAGSPTTWKWSFSGGNPATSTDTFPKNICYNAAGTYDVSLIVTNANGSDTDTVVSYITVNTIMDASISSSVGPFCPGDAAVTLTAKDGGGTWIGNGITNSTNGTFNPDTAGAGTHIIVYTIMGACGDTDSISIVINSIIDATIYPTTFCPADAPDTLRADNPNSGTWTGSIGITNATWGIFDPTLVTLGTYLITYTTTNLTCTDVGTATITVSNTTDATITPAGPFCENEGDKTLLAAVTAGGTWSGDGITNATAGTFSPTTAKGGTYTITYSIGGGCGASSTTTIVVDAVLDASFLAPPFCDIDPPGTLVAINPGQWSGNGITNATLGIFDPSIVTIGEHPITHITINGTCTTTSIKNIKVDSVFDATITLVTPKCLNAPAFTLQAATAGGTWSGTGITDVNNGTFDPFIADTGSHSITYIILGSCGDIDSVTITITEPPVVKLDITDENCPGDCDGSITASVSGGTRPYVYSWSNQSADSNIVGLCANEYTLTVTDANQCSGDSTETVVSNTNPRANFIITPNPATTSNTNVSFTDSSTFGVISWDWIFYDSDGITKLNTSSETNPVITYPAAIGEYPVYLKITDENGCVDSTAQLLLIDGEYIIYVPNAFTPNGDGFNETFFPQGVGINLNDNYHLYIFDRWGELIWESDNLNTYWDGTKDGVLVQDGVYIWKLLTQEETLEEEQHQYVGHVTVIR